MHAILGKKLRQTQVFYTDGTRMPVTIVEAKPNIVTDIKTVEKNGYWSAQLAYGTKKRATKAELGHAKKGANLEKAPSFLKEIRLADMPDVELGASVEAATVLELGDIVDVTAISKGKGFAGGVRRWGFHGGPRTHGQSDRERAPGSIGAGTTPGRVYKNKHMAGKMGNDKVTIKNLTILAVNGDEVTVSGVVPGRIGQIVTITATGKKMKKLPELVGAVKEEPVEEAIVEETPVVETPVETASEAATEEAPAVEEKVEDVQPEAPVVETAEEKPAEEVTEVIAEPVAESEETKEEEAQA